MLGPGAHEVHQVRLAANNCGMFFQRACDKRDSFHLERNVLFRIDGHWHRAPASAITDPIDPISNDFQLGSTGATDDSQNVSSIFRYHEKSFLFISIQHNMFVECIYIIPEICS